MEEETAAIYSLFGKDIFKVNFQKLPRELVQVAADIRKSNFINIYKLIASQSFLPTKEGDDVKFFMLMSNHPYAIVPICKFFLTYNKNKEFDRGYDKKYLIIKNTKAFKSMLQAAKSDHVYTQ